MPHHLCRTPRRIAAKRRTMFDHPFNHSVTEPPCRHLARTAFSFMQGTAKIACSILLFAILVIGGMYLTGILLTGIHLLTHSF